VVYIHVGISYGVYFIWDFPIVTGKPIHFGDSWLDPPVLLPSPCHNPLLDMFQNCYTLLTSLNVRISRGLEQFQSLDLAKSAQVTRIRKDDWSRADPFWPPIPKALYAHWWVLTHKWGSPTCVWGWWNHPLGWGGGWGRGGVRWPRMAQIQAKCNKSGILVPGSE
jgi:hypothetical protein